MDNRWRPSVTVAAVIERDGRFLMIEEETSEGLRINNPAGHLDPGIPRPRRSTAFQENAPDRVARQHLARVIGGAVIHHNHFERF